MGVDLRFLPYYDPDESCYFSHDIIDLERRAELWDVIFDIEKRKGRDVLETFVSYCSLDGDYTESHYGKTPETPYGEHLRWVYAKELKPLVSHPAVTDNYKRHGHISSSVQTT